MAEVAAGGSIISAHRMLGMLRKEKLFKTSLSCKNWCDKLFFAHIARFRDFWPTCDMASHFLLVVCCCALYLLATTEQQRQQSEKSEGGFRTVYDDCATTTKKKAMATTMAMSPHCLTQFRLMADKLSARYVLSNSPRPPAQIVYDAFELCFKKKSQKKTRNRRDVIAKDDLPPWWGKADRKRWQVGANVRGEKCVYCKNQLLWIFEFVKSGLATG